MVNASYYLQYSGPKQGQLEVKVRLALPTLTVQLFLQ